jgi:hypothetical protein
MHPDVQLVVQLQTLDHKISALEKEVALLPKHVAVIEKTLDAHLRKLEADRAALVANQKERKNMDGEIQLHQQKISKLRDQMTGAKNNDQYKAFQHEIEYLEKEIQKCEERILVLMSQSEPLDAAVKAAEVALKQEQTQVNAEKSRAQQRTAKDQAELDELRPQHQAIMTQMPRPIAQTYLRIRKKWNGSVAAEAISSRCTACQIVLRPQVFQDLKKLDQIINCESCGRFLYYNPPQLAVDVTNMQ